MHAEVLRELLQSRLTYIGLMLVGAALVGYFIYQDRQLSRVGSYQATPCEFQSVKVEERVHRNRRGWPSHSTYHLRPKYTYQFAGKRYTGTAFAPLDVGVDYEEAYDLVDEYSQGRNRCYVDPNNPATAVLSKDLDPHHRNGAAVFGMLTMLVGLAGWVVVDFVLPRTSRKEAVPEQAGAEPAPLEIPAWSSLGKIQANRGANT